MNSLDKLSYYLSYTHFVPFVSIPAGIVHLICAIRDRALNPQVYPPAPPNESLPAFTNRKLDKAIGLRSSKKVSTSLLSSLEKDVATHELDDLKPIALDNWSLLTKGILAIIPVIGNAILFKKWVDRQTARSNLFVYMENNPAVDLNSIPNYPFHDQEFLKRLCDRQVSCTNATAFFRKTSNANKNDKVFIREMIADNKIGFESFQDFSLTLQADNDIIRDLIENTHKDSIIHFFTGLPRDKRNTPAIAHAAFAKAVKSPYGNIANLLNAVSDKDVFKGPGASEGLTIEALINGSLKFWELSDTQKQNENFAFAALRCDFDRKEPFNWLCFPEDLRGNRILLNKFVKEIASFPRPNWEQITEALWYKKWREIHNHPHNLDRHTARDLAIKFLGNPKDVIISK